MVVVAIIGVLAAISADYMGKEAQVNAAARVTSELLGKARRLATSYGPVRADVVAATGERARAKIRVSTSASTGANLIEVFRLVENVGASFTWVAETSYMVSAKVQIYAVSDTAASNGGQALPAALGAGTKEKKFFPDGTAEASTWYLQKRGNVVGSEKWRVWVMPLSAIAAMEPVW
jgi:outer membrane murein-binding lipoprotein Lpp